VKYLNKKKSFEIMNNEPIYIDTNIIMDFILGRDKNAFILFQKVIKCNYKISISNIVLEELKFQGLEMESNIFVKLFEKKSKIKILKVNNNDINKAKEIVKSKKTHFNDALHKVISKRNEDSYFVTKNTKDFICFNDINLKKPDEL
jgi:predicted nucleic acid-binding protein